jgi:hypothetical protein
MTNDDQQGHSDEFAKRLAELLAAKVPPAPVKRRGPSVGLCSILCVMLVGLIGLGMQVAGDSHKKVRESQDALARVERGTSAPYVAPAPTPAYVAPTPAYVVPSDSVSDLNQQKLKFAWNQRSDHTEECSNPSVFAYRLWSAAEGQNAGADGSDIPIGDYTQFFQTACAKWSVGS